MYQFVAIDDDTYMLVHSDDDAALSEIATDLTMDDLGEIVIAAVSVVNPAMGDVMRSMMSSGG